MNFLWATDLHLDQDQSGFLADPAAGSVRDATGSVKNAAAPVSDVFHPFAGTAKALACDGWLLSGDIADGAELIAALERIAILCQVDQQNAADDDAGNSVEEVVYFVLGNHDFYGSSIAQARSKVVAAVRQNPSLVYLTDCGPIEIQPGSFLVGEDGWGDATRGDYEGSHVRLNDFLQIDDFQTITPDRWQARLQELGRESADRLSQKLQTLPDDATSLVILTHVPPFCESCWYEGRTTDDHWSPFFVCGQVGDVIKQFADQSPSVKVTVLCGHTHHDGVASITDNLVVHTGAAQYGRPQIEAIVKFTDNGVICQR